MDARWREYQPHPAPRRHCRCGIYALKTQQALAELRRPYRNRWSAAAALATSVAGEVSLWGNVVVHEHGYRAEYAYPRRITVPRSYRGFLHAEDGRTIRRLFAEEAAALISEQYGVGAEVE